MEDVSGLRVIELVFGRAEGEGDDGGGSLAGIEVEGACAGDVIFSALQGDGVVEEGIFTFFSVWIFGAEGLGCDFILWQGGVQGLSETFKDIVHDVIGFEVCGEFDGIDGDDGGIEFGVFGGDDMIFFF